MLVLCLCFLESARERLSLMELVCFRGFLLVCMVYLVGILGNTEVHSLRSVSDLCLQEMNSVLMAFISLLLCMI